MAAVRSHGARTILSLGLLLDVALVRVYQTVIHTGRLTEKYRRAAAEPNNCVLGSIKTDIHTN